MLRRASLACAALLLATTPTLHAAGPRAARSHAAAKASAEPESTEAAERAAVVGDTTIDVGSGQAITISPEGAIRLGNETLVGTIGLDPQATQYSHRLTRNAITVAVGVRIPHLGLQPDRVVLAHIDLLHDRLVWSAEVSADVTSRAWGEWAVVFHGRAALVQLPDALVAVDMRTGTQLWSFASVDPAFEEHYTGSLAIEHGAFTAVRTRVEGRDVLLEAKLATNGREQQLRLDVDTGRRLDGATAEHARAPRGLFEFSERVRPPSDDDQPAPPPPPPKGYRGVTIGPTALLWNERTGHGIIVNPLASATAEILAAARAQRFTAADGTLAPIDWTLVIDTATLATEMVVGKATPPKKRPKAPSIVFDYDHALDESGEVIAVDAIAEVLDAAAVGGRVDLRDLVDGVRVDEDVYGSIMLVWGPIGFHDDTHRWPASHVLRP